MARPKQSEDTTESIEAPVEQPVSEAGATLIPFSVIVNGQDRVVMARDFEDAQRQASALRDVSTRL